MPPSLEEIAQYVCCPDDGAALAVIADGLRCDSCHRHYPLISSDILNLLPSRPITFPERNELAPYRESYVREFLRPATIRDDAKAWGGPGSHSEKWQQLRERQAREVLKFLRDKQREANLILCDLSAGAGHCTFRATPLYQFVFHCDLSIDALAYASAKAKTDHQENMIFVRADYFQPPFRNSVHHLTCLDTLIRGPWHETRLLRSIQRVLMTGGAAVVDFHNWWHNPLRRLGLLPDNFSGNKSYTQRELKRLLAISGIGPFQTQPFVQEVDPRGRSGRVLARLIPPTRMMVRLAGVGASRLQTAAGRQP